MNATIESERYSPQGNISADGIQKLLGAPNLDHVEAVIRESAQNSWDAAVPPSTPRYRIHLRQLDSEQLKKLASALLNELPGEKTDADRLSQFLSGVSGGKILEISDSATAGLGGPVRADEVPEKGANTNFVDFLRNIGSPRDVHHGGGTYGYGKSSLYAASRCRTIIVDTLTLVDRKPERRLMGSMIGSRFDIRTGDKGARYTGRHWWGIETKPGSGSVLPVTGESARNLSGDLGILKRSTGDTGTSIVILDPDLGDSDDELTAKNIQRILLQFFWPKMVPVAGEKSPMIFQLFVNGKELIIPSPEKCRRIQLLAETLKKVRAADSDTIPIKSRRPSRLLGRCSFVREIRPPSDMSIIWPGTDQNFHHVALMRPAELVVKYLEGPPIQDGRIDWCGVFVCADDDEVESAFAASEPPAHDDWNPAHLPSGEKKSFVNIALKNLKGEIKLYAGDLTRDSGGLPDPGINLAAVADTIGEKLFTVDSDRLGGMNAGSQRRGRTGGNRGRRSHQGIRVGGPKFKWLEGGSDRQTAVAVFEIPVSGISDHDTVLHAVPAVLWQESGSPKSDADPAIAPNGKRTELIGWRFPQQEIHHTEGTFIIPSGQPDQTLEVLVSIPDTVAVTLTVTPSSRPVADEPGVQVSEAAQNGSDSDREQAAAQNRALTPPWDDVPVLSDAVKKPEEKRSFKEVKTNKRKKKKKKRKVGAQELRRRVHSQATGTLDSSPEARLRELERIKARKDERERVRRTPFSSSNLRSSEKHRQKCGCMGEVENCPRCFGQGWFFTDRRGNIVS